MWIVEVFGGIYVFIKVEVWIKGLWKGKIRRKGGWYKIVNGCYFVIELGILRFMSY